MKQSITVLFSLTLVISSNHRGQKKGKGLIPDERESVVHQTIAEMTGILAGSELMKVAQWSLGKPYSLAGGHIPLQEAMPTG